MMLLPEAQVKMFSMVRTETTVSMVEKIMTFFTEETAMIPLAAAQAMIYSAVEQMMIHILLTLNTEMILSTTLKASVRLHLAMNLVQMTTHYIST